MIKNCLVIGCGSHAHSVISIIESSLEKYKIIGLVDTENNYNHLEEKSGYKVIASIGELINTKARFSGIDCFLAIGDNKLRREIFGLIKSNGFKTPNVISKTAFVDRTVKMGEGNVISHGSIINSQSSLGSNNLINTGSIIEHDCLLGQHNHIGPKAVVCGNVKIGDLVFLGAGSIVLPKVNICDEIILGAGSLLKTNVLIKKSTFVGTPAKEIHK
ncbi:hypothetical protein AMR76_21820 [Vibrio furnissii]|uniref:PglD N-terminal domain-containing protein n=1 Tax=Vibrio furnissii TaxID=29494 RepID=A0A0Q2M6X7_VIBFU|nr:acetyltransferase [Vibrio furnissii]KQH83650.1 hypothetical protein AMR76_21820 [Vibrio furnissii]